MKLYALILTALVGLSAQSHAADAVTVINARATFLNQLYVNLLGRPASGPEIIMWSPWLQTMTCGQLAHGIFDSAESQARVASEDSFTYIYYDYQALLKRTPDITGLMGWLNALQQDATREQVFDGIVNSPEFAHDCQAIYLF